MWYFADATLYVTSNVLYFSNNTHITLSSKRLLMALAFKSDKRRENSYLLAELPVTDDMRSLKVRNIPLRETNLEADSDFGNW